MTAAVRSVQPAVSGLFQVKSPRVWNNGAPDFLAAWDAFQSRTGSAIMNKAYAFTTIDGLGHEVLYAGVERTSSKGPVVFEFSRLEGERSVGDLRIEVEIDNAGSIGTVQFLSHSGDGAKAGLKLLPIAILAGEGCSDAGTACAVANGASLEVGVNLSQLLDGSRFKAIKITTPEDSVVGTFSLAPFVGAAGSCVSEVGGHGAGCTANDVQLTEIVPGTLNITNNTCALDAQGNLTGTVTFSARGRFVLTSQTRYDVGLYIDTNGDPEPAVDNKGTFDAARHGQCTRFAFSNTDGVNAESPADSCGDLTQAIASKDLTPPGRAMDFGPVTIKCVDKDDDDKIDIYHCETWSQNEDEINCTSSQSVKAGTTSKCNCGILAGACIATPNTDPCKENLCALRCSNNSATVCTPGGTECTGGGVCVDTLVTRNKADGSACGSAPSGDCDAPDTCQSGVCVDNVDPSTQECRASAGVCDTAENCTGSSKTCPANGFVTGGECRAAAGDCDVPESCDGTSADCPANGFAANTVQCRASACNVADPLCCDVPENCTGSSANCPANGFDPATVECRPSAGVCDPAENCPGNAALCPSDDLYQLEDNIVCGPAQNECDAEEKCDGSGPGCPADQCAGGDRPETHFCSNST